MDLPHNFFTSLFGSQSWYSCRRTHTCKPVFNHRHLSDVSGPFERRGGSLQTTSIDKNHGNKLSSEPKALPPSPPLWTNEEHFAIDIDHEINHETTTPTTDGVWGFPRFRADVEASSSKNSLLPLFCGGGGFIVVI